MQHVIKLFIDVLDGKSKYEYESDEGNVCICGFSQENCTCSFCVKTHKNIEICECGCEDWYENNPCDDICFYGFYPNLRIKKDGKILHFKIELAKAIEYYHQKYLEFKRQNSYLFEEGEVYNEYNHEFEDLRDDYWDILQYRLKVDPKEEFLMSEQDGTYIYHSFYYYMTVYNPGLNDEYTYNGSDLHIVKKSNSPYLTIN